MSMKDKLILALDVALLVTILITIYVDIELEKRTTALEKSAEVACTLVKEKPVIMNEIYECRKTKEIGQRPK